jgi:hypothetical protein
VRTIKLPPLFTKIAIDLACCPVARKESAFYIAVETGIRPLKNPHGVTMLDRIPMDVIHVFLKV